ncbi:sec20 family protein [Tieghemostelium lacteum]|uniref:Sec20 family protein n=1 Tax=Tieghemostelium lacteum TaxID=361077 RepID=A0A152A1X4_TIELA|nr:sec20 family protein [Tieghemostelium lacteum]|eukprot:KYR00253.1 sec20 family protein [Tieghemostelium lacteum]
MDKLKDINKIEYTIRGDIVSLSNSSTVLQIQTYNTSIKTNLDILHNLIKEGSIELNEKNKSIDIKRFEKELEIHKEEFNNLKVLQKKVNLDTTKKLHEQFLLDKKKLLETSTTQKNGDPITQYSRNYTTISNNRSNEDILKTSVSLTETLRKTRNFMNSQVNRSSTMLNEVTASSRVLEKTVDQQKEYSSRTAEAKSSITKLRRRDMTDKLLIYFAVFVFMLVVLYVFKVRVGNKFLSVFYSLIGSNTSPANTLTPTTAIGDTI